MCWSGRGLRRNRSMAKHHFKHSQLLRRILQWPRSAKQMFVAVVDVAMGLISMWLAFSLRLDTLHWPQALQFLPYVLGPALAFPVFVTQGLYRAIFRYTGITALLTTGKAVAIYGAMLSVILLTAQWEGVPRSVGILQPLIFLLLVGASRSLGWLWLKDRTDVAPYRLLIYGAGSAGAQTAAGLGSTSQYQLCGFVDDDPAKGGRTINGSRVYPSKDLSRLVKRLDVTDVLLAVPSASRLRRRQIIESLRDLPVRIRTLPGLTDLASGRVTVTDFQDLDIADLLGREPVTANPALLVQNLAGKVVMVTGAGGSIGSELCRQIVLQNPLILLLVDHSEFALYNIHQELQQMVEQPSELPDCTLVPLLASVSNTSRIREILCTYRPTSVYHAAAYKHVPMVEINVSEGIRNNVFGTLIVVRAALDYGVKHFVLVSTDKAVRPTNVMGASKRIAEMILQAIAATNTAPFDDDGTISKVERNWKSPTQFSIVRFGNVLGSSGSVIPLFRRQIASGGPITVTHAEVTRYFMTIPEAAQLVLQSGAMAEGGDVFVLDMGEPIKIFELAKRMVMLSGLTVRDQLHPSGDIEIQCTGLRPGEKLHEELLIGENPLDTSHPRIWRARETFRPWADLCISLDSLLNAANAHNEVGIRKLLGEIVDGFPQQISPTSP